MDRARKKQAIVVLSLLAAVCRCAFALNPALDISQYAHTAWRFRDGFTKGEIHSITQTPDGYLWFGTGFGLWRFDGVSAVHWQPPPDSSGKAQPLPSNDIHHLLPARDGTLWIGTSNGLASWKDGKLSQYAELAGLTIYALLEDREGSIWVGAHGIPEGKLCEIRKGAVLCEQNVGELGHGVMGLHEDAKGNLWVGLMTGLWRWKPGPPEFYRIQQPDGIQSMADEADGGMLISTREGVRRLVEGKWNTAYSFPNKLRVPYAYRILRDRDGGLWGGTHGAGIVHWHQGRTDVFSESDGMTGDTVADLFEDREGNIWDATQNGVGRFRELPAVSYSEKQGLLNAKAGAFLARKDGSVWFRSRDVLYRLFHGQLTIYSDHRGSVAAGVNQVIVKGLPDPYVAALAEDSHGRIWLSPREGIGYLENDRFISTAAPGGIVTSISEDAAGNMWVAYQNVGLFRLSGHDVVERIPWDKFGHQDPADTLIPDLSSGGLWLGFFKGGIARFREGQVAESYSAKDGLGAGRVNEMRFDGAGALWAATDGGLSRLKDGRIATLSSNAGLPCDGVHWSIEDDAQSVWLMMPCGLVRIARSELDAWAANNNSKIHPTVFDSSDGVMSRDYAPSQTPHVAKSPDGKLWFYNVDGAGVVDPGHLPFNKLPPPVHIEQIVADRKVVSDGRLPALTRDLQIDYTALSLVASEKNRFKYKLEGFDRDWQDVGNRRQAFYTNLPPRSYRFHVIASNNSGVWNETGDSVEFSIAPAFYQTDWFRASVIVAFFVMLWGLYRLRLYQVSREFNAQLEGRVDERLRVARELHDTLLQSFQGLMLRFQTARNMVAKRPSEGLEVFDKALAQADRAIVEGREAIQNMRSSTTVTNDLGEAVRAVGNELASGNPTEFRFVVEGKPRDLHPILRDEIYRIAREGIGNAFRHAKARVIETEIVYGDDALTLRVRDDGVGIGSAILNDGRSGHYGVPGMRERAAAIGVRLEIWTREGAGTEIQLTVPGSIAYGSSGARRKSKLERVIRR